MFFYNTYDVAKIIVKASRFGGVYNLTDGYHPSFIEISNLICIQLEKKMCLNIPLWFAKIISYVGDLIGSKAPINNYKLKKIISDLTFDDSKARAVFAWKPKQVLKEFKINGKIS